MNVSSPICARGSESILISDNPQHAIIARDQLNEIDECTYIKPYLPARMLKIVANQQINCRNRFFLLQCRQRRARIGHLAVRRSQVQRCHARYAPLGPWR